MNANSTTKIIRINEARNIFGLSKSGFYDRVKGGFLPPSISLGSRAVGWVEQEIITVLNAMVAGKTQAEIQSLVIELTELRQKLF